MVPRIVGLPGTEATVRGFSAVSLMLIDEAARVPATECERISRAFPEEERRVKTSYDFVQEYLCESTGYGTEYFDRQLIDDAFDDAIPELKIHPGK